MAVEGVLFVSPKPVPMGRLLDALPGSDEDYVRIARDLALDLPRLTHLRASLRGRMEASPLMDGPRFARGMEAAFREMWRRWCG